MTYGIRKLVPMQDKTMASTNEVDFGSAGEDYYLETEIHSPTDSSEDSVEVKVSPIGSFKNKRKCAEPRKLADTFTGPLKKRMCMKVKAEVSESHPFRPWSPKLTKTVSCSKDVSVKTPDEPVCNGISIKTEKPQFCSQSFVVPPVPILYSPNVDCNIHINTHKYGYFRPPSPVKLPIDEQPVSLVKKNDNNDCPIIISVKKECESPCLSDPLSSRVPIHPQLAALTPAETERLIIKSNETFPSLQNKSKCDQVGSARREQRNYKNMTRERRIEANARERTRVHTISAAFDTLRKSVPAYSHNQKLSKLSVLRIACSYIRTLSSIVDSDDETTAESVETVSRTIQREGKLRKKKDDND